MKNQDSKIDWINVDASPSFSVITPLRLGDFISDKTLKTVTKCYKNFNWISVCSKNNAMKNFSIGLQYLHDIKSLGKYVIKIDNDISLDVNTLENMLYAIETSPEEVGYVYSSFSFYGNINSYFPAKNFDSDELRNGNYISSCSMFKSDILLKYGVVTDEKYVRLLDWALLLRLLKNGIVGKPCPGYFEAYSTPTSVSTGSMEDYIIKKQRVLEDFL